ncbi:FecR family protein [Actomonas aquatica]|uniref:FecR domain-containing protein n=1 Tax=Actomonas aquatica TaxID=2866162 RepID=A0ABZ1C362_9BACT|nr:FecR domain-containing protein [Opitutus sp. WL0086]WRQ85772.1 FecR domain-containing protein [Opitutus sp. WL0086]
MSRSSSTRSSPSSAEPECDQTLLDRVRQQGWADDLVDRIELQVRQRKRRRRLAVKAAGAALSVAALLLWAVPYAMQTEAIETPAGSRETVAMADGSTADMNAQTRLWTDFRYGRRVVKLEQGEAYFAVRSDEGKPFVVETPRGAVRVTGTAFNVRLAGSGEVEVTLVEGSVDWTVGDETVVSLAPGQQLRNGDESRLFTLSANELQRAVSWRDGQLVLDGITVAEAAARVSTFHDKPIRVDEAVATLRLGGTCSLDSFDEFLATMTATRALRVSLDPDGVHRIGAQ